MTWHSSCGHRSARSTWLTWKPLSRNPSLLMVATNRAQCMTCPSGRGDQRAKDISDDGRVCVFFFNFFSRAHLEIKENRHESRYSAGRELSRVGEYPLLIVTPNQWSLRRRWRRFVPGRRPPECHSAPWEHPEGMTRSGHQRPVSRRLRASICTPEESSAPVGI